LFPFQEESGPLNEHHRQKLSLNLGRRAVAPLDVKVQEAVGATKKVNSHFPIVGLVHVKMGRQMVVGIKPQAQPRDLYTVNLAQAFPFTRLGYQRPAMSATFASIERPVRANGVECIQRRYRFDASHR
jgi:hypothetical protein